MMSEKDSKIVEVEEKLNDITECSICAETFKDPKILSCIHTFCKNCLHEVATKLEKSTENVVPCPICRKKFLIPVEGVDGLQKNFFMENLIEMRKILNSFSNVKACEACLEEDPSVDANDLPTAEVYCTDCKQKLCKECQKYHFKNKSSKNHKLLYLNELHESVQTKVNTFMPGVCDKHELQPLNIFCSDCTDAVCSICFVEDHKSHKGSAVDSVVNDFRNQIQENVDGLKNVIPDLKKKEKNLEDDKRDFTENLNQLEMEIIKSRDELRPLVDAHSDSLLSDLKTHRETSLKNMEIYKDDLQTLLISLDSFHSYCTEIVTIGSSSSICKAIKSLNNRAAELRTLSGFHYRDSSQFRQLRLSKRLLSAEGNVIGELKDTCPAELDEIMPESKEADHEKANAEAAATESTTRGTNRKRKYPGECIDGQISDVQTTDDGRNMETKIRDLEQQVILLRGIALGQNAPNESSACSGALDYKKISKTQSDAEMFSVDSNWDVKALDILDNEVYIAVKAQNLVLNIYDLKSFRFKRRWKNERLTELKHMKTCRQNQCLYLIAPTKKDDGLMTTTENYEIVSFDLNGSMIKCWSIEDAVGLLSITNEANVLFTAQNKGQLQEYSPEGQLLRVIPLSWNFGFEHPWHSIKLNSSHYVVCHGRDGDLFQRICIIDNEGNVLHYTGKGLSLRAPAYMEKDKDNNIIVIDNDLKRLFVFNSTLEEKNSQLYRTEGQMLSICADECNRRLFVVEKKPSQSNRGMFAVERDTWSQHKISALIFDTESPPS